MYDEEILQELYQANTYLYQVNENLSTLDNRLITLQEQIESGDKLIIENQEMIKNTIGLEALILMAILLYLFIVRSLK